MREFEWYIRIYKRIRGDLFVLVKELDENNNNSIIYHHHRTAATNF